MSLGAPPTALSLGDAVALVKPRITTMVVITAVGGMALAPGGVGWSAAGVALLGIVLSVGGANALNMYLERDTDGLMERTRNRPLPAGRVAPAAALIFGIVLAAASVPVLLLGVNTLTAALSTFALVAYVALYTPLKRRSWTALLVGAVPGAIPPLLGWTSVTGTLDLGGVLLFAVLFVWQVPHFLAIALFRSSEYERAGIRVHPLERGPASTRVQIVAWTVALVAVASWAALEHLRAHGLAWIVVVSALNVGFFACAAIGLRAGAGDRWARQLFLASLVYLTALFGLLVAAQYI